MTEEQYINFDEYIRQGEPQKRERADAWRVAIGLQAVDGLKTSAYLQELARRNIEGELTIDEVVELINQYYSKKKQKAEQAPDKHMTSTLQVPRKYPSSTPQAPDNLPDNLPDMFSTKNQYIISLVMVIGLKEMSIKEMLEQLGLKNRESFMDVYLNPAIKEKFVRVLYRDNPHHPRQKYLLTAKGIVLYNEIIVNH